MDVISVLRDGHYVTHEGDRTPARVAFWLRELRTPELLIALARQHLSEATAAVHSTRCGPFRAMCAIARRFAQEEEEERRLDRKYRAPLRLELERFRRDGR